MLATPLLLAGVAATIANDGVYVRPTLRRGAAGRTSRATTRKAARTIARFMRRVVTDGTGGAAAIEGVKVAGKTGTAELRDSSPEPTETPGPGRAAAGRGHDRHRRVVRRLRADGQATDCCRRPARGSGRGR